MATSKNTGRVRVRTRLPTAVPGVTLRMSGRVHYRSDTPITHDERRTVRVAAAHSVYLLARELSHSCLPGQDHGVEEDICLALTQWQQSPLTGHPGLQVRARAKVTLPRANRRRMDEYHAARRRHHRELTCHGDELDHFSSRVLRNLASARFWWVENHGTSEETNHTFDELFLPLIGDGDGDRDRTIKIAAIIAEAIRRLEHDPGEYEKLVQTVESLLRLTHRSALADEIRMDNPET